MCQHFCEDLVVHDGIAMLSDVQIWRINTKHNVLYLHGQGTPGPIHSFARIYDSVCRKHFEKMESPTGPPMPTFYSDDAKEPLPEEIYDKDLYQFTDQSIVYSIEETDKKKIKRKT